MLPMEKARYRAKAVAWSLGEASTGTPQVGVEFEVQDGDHKGERISGYFALSDAAAEYTLEKLRNCGWTGSDIGELEDKEASASMASKQVELVCEPEDVKKDGQLLTNDDGSARLRLRIQFVNRAGGLAMKKSLSDDSRRALAAKMRAKLAALDARNGGPPAQTAKTPVANGGAVDDIPF